MTDASRILAAAPIDSVLLIGFGGPTRPDEVMPFLRNVAGGRPIPEDRLRKVEHHYLEVGGRSPYNDLTERQRRRLEVWLAASGRPLPVYTGMRNWHPFLSGALQRMAADGCRRAAGVILAAHRSEASTGRYLDDLRRASAGEEEAPQILPLAPWFDHPRFIEANGERIEEATGFRRGAWPAEVPVIFTAHSIPARMAEGSPYVADLRASCEGTAALLGLSDWELAYQSRSGDPRTPWLEPDIGEVVRRRAAAGAREVVVHSIGFLCDHVEVLYDLDVEARRIAEALGLRFHRPPCVNDHPEFIAMIGELVLAAATPG